MQKMLSRLIEMPKIPDERGNLSFIEAGNHVPFEIRRSFYLYDVPGGEAGQVMRCVLVTS